MYRPKRALIDAALHDVADRAGDARERRKGVAIEMRAAFGHLPQHDRGEEAVLRDEAGNPRDDLIQLLDGGGAGCRDGAQPFAGSAEGVAQQGPVQPLLAAEVVVEHRLVDAGSAGDAIDAGAGIAAGGEFDGGGRENPVGRDAGGACHKLTS
jgi:hypothetical protein